MTAPALLLDGVGRRYGDGERTVVALDGVNLSINSGEYVAIIGPSGAGKSSLLNILGCLDVPTSGTLAIGGTTVGDLSATGLARLRNSEIGFVFQSFNLIPTLTAVQNVALPLVYGGVARAARFRRASEALERVGLSGRAGHKPNQLSGGQQQRVAVARAIVNNPSFILADEPTGNLDSHATEDVLAIFEGIHRAGSTVVIITHELDVAEHAERVLVMKDGRIDHEYLNERSVA